MTFEEFKQINKAKGQHFFSEDTMNFFRSRVSTWRSDGYFITREATGFDRKKFAYSIRYAVRDTGSVEKVSEFLAYKTLAKANRELNKIEYNLPLSIARKAICRRAWKRFCL